MVRVALLSRVTITTATLINRYCIDFYTHFSRMLPVPAVRFAWGGKRPPGYAYFPKHNQLIASTPEPGGNRPWHSHGPVGDRLCPTLPIGKRAARRPYAGLPDPQHDNTRYALPNPRIPQS